MLGALRIALGILFLKLSLSCPLQLSQRSAEDIFASELVSPTQGKKPLINSKSKKKSKLREKFPCFISICLAKSDPA